MASASYGEEKVCEVRGGMKWGEDNSSFEPGAVEFYTDLLGGYWFDVRKTNGAVRGKFHFTPQSSVTATHDSVTFSEVWGLVSSTRFTLHLRVADQRQLQLFLDKLPDYIKEKVQRRQNHDDLQTQLREIQPLEQNLQRQSREMAQREENSQRQLREMQQHEENSQTQLREIRQREENPQRQLREMQQREENSQRQFREMQQREENLQRQLWEIQQREENSQRQLREMQQRDENSQRQLRELQQRDEDSQRQLRELQQRDENSQRQLREMQQREENLQRQLREMEQREENSQRQSREMQQRKGNLQRQLREVQQRGENSLRQLREMQQREENSQRQLREMQQLEENSQRQLTLKDRQVNELQLSFSTAQRTINELRSQEGCDWVIARDEIQMTEKCLGRGAWASVYEGMYCGCACAVKQIHDLIISRHNIRLFEREMKIASKCRHPCLLQFIGATNDGGSPLFVTELMETSLRTLLEQRQLSEAEMFVISLDVARALNYLHQKKPEPIIHRDVSSANVLLWRQSDQWRAKVSDYGTANVMQNTMTVAPGAVIYSAPEAVTSNQTVKVDVYSFGVLLCEMCIGELPEPSRRDEQVVLVTNQVLRGLVRRCLQVDPNNRPNMQQIIDELSEVNTTP